MGIVRLASSYHDYALVSESYAGVAKSGLSTWDLRWIAICNECVIGREDSASRLAGEIGGFVSEYT